MSCSTGKGGISHLFSSLFKNSLSKQDKKSKQPLVLRSMPPVNRNNNYIDDSEHVRLDTAVTISMSGSGTHRRNGVAPSTTVEFTKRKNNETMEDSFSNMSLSSQNQKKYELPNDIDLDLCYPTSEIIDYWRDRESSSSYMNKYDAAASYIKYRRIIVEWTFEVTDDLRLQPVTVYSAVSLMDQLFCSSKFDSNDWILQAICCISIACKMEEAERNMPLVSDIGNAVEMRLPTSAVTEGELEVSKHFNWCTSRVTPMHYLGFYLHQGVIFPSDLCQNKPIIAKIRKYMKKYVLFFANLCQQEYTLVRFKPSLLAASSILAARKALCISPLWRGELEELCNYDIQDLHESSSNLWKYYEDEFPSHRPLKTPPTVSSCPTKTS